MNHLVNILDLHLKKFDEADKIRKQLAEAGITVEDTPDGVRWTKE